MNKNVFTCPFRKHVECTHIKDREPCQKCGWNPSIEVDRKMTIKLQMLRGSWNGRLTL